MTRTFATWAAALVLLAAGPALAQEDADIQTRTVAYTHDGEELEGYLAYPAGLDEDDARPGVLVIHEWWGLNDYPKMRARQLAEMGYVAFAADMYGRGKVTEDPARAKEWASALYGDRATLRERARAGLEQLRELDTVEDDNLAAIGFCFGGTTVTELAYSGVEGLDGVVSFHGNPRPMMQGDDPGDTELLFLHGAADPMVSDDSLREVFAALDAAGAEHRMVEYPGAVHAFSNPGADAHGIEGVAYDEAAAEQSWSEMQRFLERVFEDAGDADDQADDGGVN